jgi:hypothetical protein
VGNLEPTWDRIHDHIRQLGVADADGHEIRAIAIELGVAERLRLPFCRGVLCRAGARNSRSKDLHCFDSPSRFDAEVTRVEGSPSVVAGIQYVLEVLDATWAASLP